MSKNSAIISLVVVALVFGVGGFFGGSAYAKSKQSTSQATTTGRGTGQYAGYGGGAGSFRRGTGTGGGNGGAGFTAGQILSKDNDSITLKLLSGSTEIVYYSSTTQVTLPTVTSPASLQVGQNVTVQGAAGSSGTMTAQNIQVRPNVPNASSTPGSMAPMMPAQ